MVQAPPLVVYVHFIAALAAMAIGAVQLVRPKGTAGHRVIGWTWAALMMVVALSSLWIPAFLAFTWIHLFTLFVMVTLPLALYRAHRGEVAGHAKGMRGIYVGGLIGRIEQGTVVDSSAGATVMGLSRVGGVVGESCHGTMSGCRARSSASSGTG